MDRPWYLVASPLATLPWQIRLRWTSAAIEASIAVISWSLPDLDLPLRRVAAILAAAALSNALAAASLQRDGELPRLFSAFGLVLDAILMAALLELTGGPFNPFVVVFALQIALAGLTLGRRYAVPVGLAATACFALVTYWHLNELEPGHHRVNDFPTHLFAMWMLLATALEIAFFFVAQASLALAQREEALEAMRLRAARSDRIASLTTLAAGAAHELSTPLATIALAARELEHALAASFAPGALADDAKLIRAEVDRCRTILDQMSGRAGGAAQDLAEPVDVEAVLGDVRSALPFDQARRVRLDFPGPLSTVPLPRAGFRQAVLSLVKNACEASEDAVSVRAEQRGERLRLTVRDSGPGLAPDVRDRAGEPFFSTKDAGRGMGLGLFLARVFAERLGGSLTLTSDSGTIASLDLPIPRT